MKYTHFWSDVTLLFLQCSIFAGQKQIETKKNSCYKQVTQLISYFLKAIPTMMKSTATLMILVALQIVEVQCDTLPTVVVHQNSSEVCPSETKQQAALDELKVAGK